MATKEQTGETTFRVSDVAEVPLRGYLLRLTVTSGTPSLAAIRKGRLRFTAPDGTERIVRVKDLALMGGRATQKRLEDLGQIDLIVPVGEAVQDGRPISLGWTGSVHSE